MKLLPLCFLLLKSALVIASDMTDDVYPFHQATEDETEDKTEDKTNDVYPFHQAAKKGDKEAILQLLKEEDANQRGPDDLDADGNTALHIAVANGHLHCLQLLTNMISSDVIHQLNQKEQTPLDLAILSGKPSVLAFFLDHGADPDLAGFQTQLLHTAIRNGNPETISSILQSGMKPDQTEGDNWGFLHIAASYNQPEILKALREGLPETDINQKDPNGITPLHIAAFKGHTENVRYLLTARANPALTDNSGQTALQIAAQNGKLETVQAITDTVKKSERRRLQLQEVQNRRLTIDKPKSQDEDTGDERLREKIPDRAEELCLCPCLLM